MVQAGHVRIATDGELLSTDDAFCDIMRSSRAAILGRFVLDVTAPADRSECADALERLRKTRRTFVMIKRIIRGDGSLIWVRNTVSITIDGDRPPAITATVEPVDEPGLRHGPASLLDLARSLIAARRDRASVCDPILFAEPGWDMILEVYVAEAEGRGADLASLAVRLGRSEQLTERWVRALVQHDVLEIEYRRPNGEAPKAYLLTAATHARLEAYLDRVRPILATMANA